MDEYTATKSCWLLIAVMITDLPTHSGDYVILHCKLFFVVSF